MKRAIIAVAAIIGMVVAAGQSGATPGEGVISAPVVAQSKLVDDTLIKFKINGHHGKRVIKVREPSEVVTQQVVLGPLGSTGWHTHPGPAVVLVKSGALTLYRKGDPKCLGATYDAGEAFIDSGRGAVHIGRNLSKTDNVELWVTFFGVPAGESPRIDAPDPGNCDF